MHKPRKQSRTEWRKNSYQGKGNRRHFFKEFNHDAIPAGIFLTESFSNEEIQHIIKYAVGYHRILFSPFERDVKRGIPASLAIRVRVFPFINTQIMSLSEVNLTDVFVSCAKRYENPIP